MDRPAAIPLRIGDWRVDPIAGQISRGGEVVRLEARTMRLLICLAEHAGESVSIDDLLDRVWAGVVVTPDSVYQAVASLRRVLGDDAKLPRYIATVPRLGYRMVAAVNAWEDQLGYPPSPISPAPGTAPNGEAPPSDHARTARGPRPARAAAVLAVAAIGAAVIVAFLVHDRAAGHRPVATAGAPQRSIAVLPFLDLTTQEMNEEYFADGMTEELIDRLSKIPGLHVPAPTASFYFKGRKIPLADIARSLGVAYVLDGSIRKSGDVLRVAARLVRADDGYVIWSETYDRPVGDKLMIQDDIAGEVAKALRASLI